MIVSWFLLLTSAGQATAAETEDAKRRSEQFEREVRPLLVQHCQKCHGLKKQEGALRLDVGSKILAGGDSGPAVVPGQPGESLLIAAVRHEGGREMPPNVKLKPQEIAVLEQWIREGAWWPTEKVVSLTRSGPPTAEERGHWSLQPVVRGSAPAVKNTAWGRNPIDAFVLQKLEESGLSPRSAADKRTLLRRVTFDLTGLPPTPEEIAAFLEDENHDAYERVVERLLASPHYGERWGRHWLDVARYADTAGDGADYPVPEAHLYRNWVIRAFNADLPFEDFLGQQLAGDILARERFDRGEITNDEYADLVTATGYLAVSKRFGYNVNTEFQHLDIADTIETVGRSLLGLSLGCARCHDHKYEPVTAEDYYALYGIFASSTFAFPGGEEHKRPANFVPLIPPKDAEAKTQQRQHELARFEQELQKIEQERKALYETARFAGGLDFGFEAQNLSAPPAFPWFTAGPNQVIADAQSSFSNLHPAGTRGLRIAKGALNEGIRQQFPVLNAAQAETLHFQLDFRNVDAPENPGAYRLFLSHGVITSMGIEISVEANAISIRSGDKWEEVRKLETGAWYNLQLTLDLKNKKYSGRIGRPDDVVEFNDKSFATGWNGLLDTFISDNLGQRRGTIVTRDLDNLGLSPTPFASVETKNSNPSAARDSIALLTGDKLRTSLAGLDERVKKVTAARDMFNAATLYPVAYGVSESQPANARLQRRGEPTQLGQEVPRRWLTVLGETAVANPANGSGRRDLANWVTDPSNPLTARVFVNRLWQHHFGAGLVATPSDFGIRGERPSHPELLDWLAAELHSPVKGDSVSPMRGSMKSLHRLMVMSETYRQSSDDNDATAVAADSQNRLLWHFPRRRLSAEAIRDSMLFVSGNLDDQMPGPHPFPPVYSWGFTIHYPFSANYDSNHRSVYLMVQRAKKHPYLSLFDGADPNLSTDVRPITTTPTQSLFLMNDPFVHVQAETFARRLLQSSSDPRERAALAIETAHGFRPSEDQIDGTLAFVQQYEQRLAGIGKSEDEQKQLSWCGFCRVLLTSNAFLFVD